MIRFTSLALLIGACTLEVSIAPEQPAGDGREQVALVPVTVTSDLDLLFVMDDSPGALNLQQSLQAALPAFVQALEPVSDGLPNLHIGVISTDLGTSASGDALVGPAIGSGPGSCSGHGKDGALQATSAITGTFISDVDVGGGMREKNYTATLADTLGSLTALGANGCGFEQPLRAAQRAFDNNPANTGFLRQYAPLAIVVITNEDDCSISHSTLMGTDTQTLGPLQSFRCTRFGVTCDDHGASPTEMNAIGPKSRCHANPATDYLTSVSDIAAFVKSLEHDSRNILFGAIAGFASSIDVELRVPPGGGTAIPALGHACMWDTPTDVYAADPAVRIADLASQFARNRTYSVCGGDMHTPVTELAREMRSMMGRDACLTRDIKLPADCIAIETHGGGIELALPACNGTPVHDCWRLVDDPACPGQGLRMDFLRTQAPAPDTMTALRCKV
jgi:hypothetical protein